VAKGHSVAFGQSGEVGLETAHRAFEPPARVQTSLLAARERRLLDELCRRMPAWVTPDRLTALGSAGAAIAAIGYVGSHWDPAFLLLSSLGVAINWFGDSLNGSLARHRRIERPRYGYFLDHSVDALNGLVFAIGLGLSPYVSMASSLLLLSSYYLLTLYVFLSAQVNREFPLTKAYVGPTELRLLAIAFNCAIFACGPISVRLAGTEVSVYSALVAIEAIAFIAVFAIEVFATARRLKRQDAGAAPVA
jgi:phosphatidylglycerophosphate synthase